MADESPPMVDLSAEVNAWCETANREQAGVEALTQDQDEEYDEKHDPTDGLLLSEFQGYLEVLRESGLRLFSRDPRASQWIAGQLRLLEQQLKLMQTRRMLADAGAEDEAGTKAFEAERQAFIAQLRAIAERGRRQDDAGADADGERSPSA